MGVLGFGADVYFDLGGGARSVGSIFLVILGRAHAGRTRTFCSVTCPATNHERPYTCVRRLAMCSSQDTFQCRTCDLGSMAEHADMALETEPDDESPLAAAWDVGLLDTAMAGA